MNSTLVPPTATAYRLGFASLDREVTLPVLPLTGNLPGWLTGTLLRNGPARFAVGATAYRHWFDGLAMIHRFTLANNSVSYANRFLRTPAFTAAERSGRIARPEFATNPQRTLLERILAPTGPGSSHNANVNIVPFGDACLALTETPSPVAFDPLSLETRGVLTYDDALKGPITTAHSHYDIARRATFNVVIAMGRHCAYHVVRIPDGTLARSVIATISVDSPAYLHAFAMTPRYVIIVEYPLVVRPLDLLVRRAPYIETYRWEPQRGTRFHVIDKDAGTRLATYDADAFFAFHHVNAHEERDSIVLDICAYDDASIIDAFMLDRLRAATSQPIPHATLRRYRLVPGQTGAMCEHLPQVWAEMPRIAPIDETRAYRFMYGVDRRPDGTGLFERIVKIDVTSHTMIAWTAPDAHPGEPIFVARPGATEADDGVLLSVVLDVAAQTSYLVVLDARTLTELARAHVPHHIPFGFHGIFRNAE
jgi:carotenoid cleavage dioxygenase-like enzyme